MDLNGNNLPKSCSYSDAELKNLPFAFKANKSKVVPILFGLCHTVFLKYVPSNDYPLDGWCPLLKPEAPGIAVHPLNSKCFETAQPTVDD